MEQPPDLPRVNWHSVGANGSLISQAIMGLAIFTAGPGLSVFGWVWFLSTFVAIAVTYLIVRRHQSPGWWLVWPVLCLARLASLGRLDPAAAQLVTGLITVFFLFAGLTQPRGRSLLLLPFALVVLGTVLHAPFPSLIVRLGIAAMVWAMASELPAYLLEELAVRQHVLARKANTDALTGARNRHGLEVMLSVMRGHAFLVIVDLDEFKSFNDRFGHVAGDRVLVDFAAMLARETRYQDIVVRYGGEEFLVVLADVTQATAERVAARWAKMWRQHSSGVTFSAGITDLRDDKSISSADAALYAAKAAGRNRTVVASS